MGYYRAGIDEILGVDIQSQPRYPFRFIQADAMTFSFDGFDAVHASPPCQRYSVNTKQHKTAENHPDYIATLRARLIHSGLLYVIENVPGAPLQSPIILCGSMFGISRLRRHRLFESNVKLTQMECQHARQQKCISVAGHPGGSSNRDGKERFGSTADWKKIMGIDWMTGAELAQAIPPVYTEFIGRRLLDGGTGR